MAGIQNLLVAGFAATQRCGRGLLAGAFICAALAFPVTAGAQETNMTSGSPSELKRLSIEELMNIEVTSVSKKEEKLSAAPAAIFVITQEDIRRAGVLSIPEALHMAPGLDVGRVDAHSWAVSARGFNDVFANKLLVLMDGRSVYTPLFSGVFWDVQDTMIEDIDRIEVIRGPGAALWGANAVNGVINIISKPAKDTQGWLATAGGGSEEQGFVGARYGGELQDGVHYRVYGKFFNQDDSTLAGGNNAEDRWRMGRGGFRIDWDGSQNNLLTLQGDGYFGDEQDLFAVPAAAPPFIEYVKSDSDVAGGNILGRWTHTFADDSSLQLQMYYDRTLRDATIVREDRDTADIDLQHRFLLGQRQEIVWGLNYRVTADDLKGSTNVSLSPSQRTTHLVSAFVQDEIDLVPDRLRLTLGSKFEHNDFTGFEIQPSARLLWTPRDRHTVWASVSRAVRTPSRAEDDVTLNPPGAPVGFATAQGQRSFDSEELLAYEIGYRVQPHARVSLDLAGFYNVYDRLRTAEPNGGFTLASSLANRLEGETYGLEVAARWQVTDWWRLQPTYSLLQMELHRDANSQDSAAELAEGDSPQNQFSLRSSMDLPGRIELDCWLRYVDSLGNLNVPSYMTLDIRLGWRMSPNVEFAIVGQNLLENRHLEFKPSTISTQTTEIERSVYGKITIRF